MPKNEALLKDIKKLIDLGVSEEEIVLNLKEVGISDNVAKQLISQVKAPDKEQEEEREEVPILTDAFPKRGKSSQIRVEEEIIEGKEFEEKPKQEGIDAEKEFKKIAEQAEKALKHSKEKGKERKEPSSIERVSSQDIWARGILTTINAKIDEMGRIKGEIAGIVDQRIENSMGKEREKIKALFESKQQAFSSSIDSKFAELKQSLDQTSRNLNEKLQKAESAKQLSQDTLSQINSKIDEMNKLKQKFLEQTASESAKQQGEIKKFMENSKRELQEMQQRLDRALELITKLTEGLVQSSEQKFNELWKQKEKDTDKVLEKKLSNLMQLQKATDTGALEQKVRKLNEETLRELTNQLNQLKLSVLEEIEKAKSSESITKKIDEKIAELEGFKKQFFNVIERNTSSLNKTRDEMYSELAQAQKKLQEKANLVDAKMLELEEFEKTFAEEMGVILEKSKETGHKKKKK